MVWTHHLTKIKLQKCNAPVDNIDFVVKQLFSRMWQMMRISENKATKAVHQTQNKKKKTFHGKRTECWHKKDLTLQPVKGDHRRISKQEESEICTEIKQHKFISCGWTYKAVQHCFFLLNNESGFMSVSAGPRHRQEPDSISIAMTTEHIRSDSSGWYAKIIYFGGGCRFTWIISVIAP